MTDRRMPGQHVQLADADDSRTMEGDKRRPFTPPRLQELGKLETLTRQFGGTL